MSIDQPPHRPAPGTERPRRFRPRLRYELVGCGLHGHELIGTDVAVLRPQDEVVVRDIGGLRWYRCLRCDSWLPLPPPERPTVEHLADRDHIELPLRGRPLRDRYVLRLIAVDRALHVVVLAALAVAIFALAAHQTALRDYVARLAADLQGGVGGPVHSTSGSFLDRLHRLLAVNHRRLYLTGMLVAGYAALEAVEMVGLWLARRWAEYLTFVATTLLVPLEVYELTHRVSALKVVTLLINLAIVGYLLLAKRLFGLRGGGAAEQAERVRDTGWQALERATPSPGATPGSGGRSSPSSAAASGSRAG